MMRFTKKSCVSEQGKPYYNIIVPFVVTFNTPKPVILPLVVLAQKTALKSIPTMEYIPAMWFTKKSSVSKVSHTIILLHRS